jgi:hypothetical protein
MGSHRVDEAQRIHRIFRWWNRFACSTLQNYNKIGGAAMKIKGIASHEQEIRGEWVVEDGKVQGDDNCRRIEALILNYLQRVGSDTSGWAQLYLDANDDRYWELTYPEGERHGGGPPRLACLSVEKAREKYAHILN